MLIHRSLPELMGYSQTIGDYTIIPVRIDADDINFEVEFQVINKDNKKATYCRRGKHNNFVFTTSVKNIPLSINIDGVIKKVRK